jgi:hypothetical protein
MARWYEGAEEAAFKPFAGGYVFQCPNPWLMGRSRNYLVNEAQKAALAESLRRHRRQILLLVIVYMVIAFGLALFVSQAPQGLSTFGFAAIVAVTVLAVVSIVLVPQVYLMRSIRPLLADLQRTDERITYGERLQSVAAAISGKLLLLGGIGGIMTIVGNIVTVADAISQDRAGSNLYRPVFGLVFGALLTGYFAYLAVLKRKLKRKAN